MTQDFHLPVPGALEEQDGSSFARLVELMRRLLGPGGCPWDREQDFKSLRRYVLEEACEVIDAIDGGDAAHLQEELGDLALQVVFLSELARREAQFGPDDVVHGICEKLVRRHPHVFGEAEVSSSEGVTRAWEAIKAKEKGPRDLFGGIPRAYPALMRAQKLSDKAAQVGFDWPDVASSRRKVAEEVAELDEAIAHGDREKIADELGDVFFTLVNLARQLGIDAEVALRATGDKFTRRFNYVEQRILAQHGDWPLDAQGKPTKGHSLQELDAFWDEAKRELES